MPLLVIYTALFAGASSLERQLRRRILHREAERVGQVSQLACRVVHRVVTE